MDLPNTKRNHVRFSLQQGDDLVVDEDPCLVSFQQVDHNPDLHENVSMVDGKGKSIINCSESSTRKRTGNRATNKSNLDGSGLQGDGEDDRTQKKMVHREIERQRRQEMTKLYASLRDLLPLEFVKGNRSMSDHMHQAVNYIKHMEENLKGLSVKRDQLRKSKHTNESSTNQLPNTVSISFCDGGVEISINSCMIEDGFSLSGVLNTLLEQGLNITSCISITVNDRLLHSIQSEANDRACVDLSVLQQRLVFVTNTMRNFY